MAHKHSPRFLALVEEVRKRVRETSIEEVREKIERRDEFALIDCREAEEFARGHLPGAAHLCKGTLERDIEKAAPEMDKPIVIYCGGGYRSALAADNVQKMGYTNIISMDGGYRGWTEAGYLVEG